MEVKDGFVKTDIGIIPTEWGIISIGESSVLKARIGWQGLTTAEYLTIGEYYLVTGTDFEDGKIGWSTCHFVNARRYDQDRNIQIRVNDVLVTKDGTIGKVAYINDLPSSATLNSGIFVIRPINDQYYPNYLFYILRSFYFIAFLNQLSAGSTISHLYQKDFVFFKIPLPPTLTEQRAIATALSDVDRLLSACDQLIAKKKAIKQGAMQELLTGRRRLEGFRGEWETVKLGEVLKVRHGKSQQEVSDKNGVYPILATGGQIGWANAFIYNRPSVLIGRKGTIDVPQYMETPFWCVDTLFFTEVSDRAIPKFLFYRFCLINWYNYNEASGVPSLNASTIENIEIAFPNCKTEQGSIVSILTDMDAEIAALEQQRDKYKAVKAGMMQELLTGKTRLI
jgi:type I restriction enzyme S subunit